MNKVILLGNMTRDPEMRTTQNGTTVCSFGIAVRRKYAKDGQMNVDFINCTAWRSTAEFIGKYFHKGQPIAVVGSLQIDSYEKDGKSVTTATVVVDEVDFAGKKDEPKTEVFGGITDSAEEKFPWDEV